MRIQPFLIMTRRHQRVSVVLLYCLIFCFLSPALSLTSFPNSTLLFAPISPATLAGNATARRFYIVARDTTGAAVGSGGSIFAAELFTANPPCDTNITTPACAPTCSPLLSPHAPSWSCVSAPTPINANGLTGPNWSVANVTDLLTGQYAVDMRPEFPGAYALTVFGLTGGGLRGDYYDNVWFIPPTSQSRIDSAINFNWIAGAPITPFGVNYVSARWTGKLQPIVSETFTVTALADDWVRVWIDRRLIINAWGGACCNASWGAVSLRAFFYHDVIVEYAQINGAAQIALSWQSPSTPQQIIPSARLFYRTPILNAPFTVTFTPGNPPAAANSYATDGASAYYNTTNALSTGAVAGNWSYFIVQTVDAFNNALTNATAQSYMNLIVVGADPAPLTSIAYLSSGIWLYAYAVAVAGNYTISVIINGTNIARSPFNITAAPGLTSPSMTAVTGIANGISGVTQSFSVQLRDANGNNRAVQSTDSVQSTAVNAGSSVSITAAVAYIGGGAFTVTFTPTSAGPYAINVWVNTVALPSSPYSIAVVSGALLPAASAVVGTGGALTSVTAGNSNALTITAQDMFANVISSGAYNFVVAITNSAYSYSGIVSYVSGGAYSVVYSVAKSGAYNLSVTYGGYSVAQSPYALAVTAGAPSVQSGATPPSSMTAGAVATFNITAFDTNANRINVGGSLLFTAALSCGASAVVVAASISDYTNGIYNAMIVPAVSGACTLAVKYNGANLSGGPYAVTVLAGPPSALYSNVTGAGLTAAKAGVTAALLIRSHDANNNSIAVGGAPFVVAINSAQTSVAVALTDFGNGMYTATYTATVASSYTTSVAVYSVGALRGRYYTDQTLTGLFATRYDAGINFVWLTTPPIAGMSAAYYSVQWDGKMKLPSTALWTFYIAVAVNTAARLYINGAIVIDAGNPGNGATEVFGSVSLAGGSYCDVLMQLVAGGGGGSVSLYYSNNIGAVKQLVPVSVLYHVDNLPGSPFTTVVSPAASSAATSTYTVSGGNGGGTFVAALPLTVTVQLFDAFNNAQVTTTESSAVAAVLTTGAVVRTASTTNIGGGLYQIVIYPTVPGSSTVTVTYSGSIIGASQSVVVTAGAVSAAACVAISPLTPTTAGATSVLIQTRDAANNNLTADAGNMFSATLYNTLQTYYGVTTYTGNGIYNVTYTATAAGNYSLAIAFGGANIAGSPFVVNVTAAAPSPAQTVILTAFANEPHSTVSGLVALATVDAYGNALTTGGTQWLIRLSAPALNASARGYAYDFGNGTYQLLYDAPLAGTYIVDVELVRGYYGSGLSGTYYNNRWITPPSVAVRVDPIISFVWGTNAPITPTARSYVSAVWNGLIFIANADVYTFTVAVNAGARLFVDNLLIIDQFLSTNAGSYSNTSTFATSALHYAIQLQYRQNTGAAFIQLNYSCANQGIANQIIPTAILYPGSDVINTGGPVQVIVS